MPHISTNNSLFVIWSSSDPEVAENLVFMYAHNSLQKLWWDRVRLIIWGPSAKLVAENEPIKTKLREMMDDGVEVWACRACSDNYGVTEMLENENYNVCFVGEPVTNMLKNGWKQLTF